MKSNDSQKLPKKNVAGCWSCKTSEPCCALWSTVEHLNLLLLALLFRSEFCQSQPHPFFLPRANSEISQTTAQLNIYWRTVGTAFPISIHGKKRHRRSFSKAIESIQINHGMSSSRFRSVVSHVVSPLGGFTFCAVGFTAQLSDFLEFVRSWQFVSCPMMTP